MSSVQATEGLAALLERAHSGDEAALMQLLQQYEPRLRTAARVWLGPLLRPHMDSLDLVQSVHRILLPGLRAGKFNISSPAQLLALALTVIRRKIARHCRRFQHEQSFPASPRGSEAPESFIPSRSAEDDPAHAAQIHDALNHLLDSLNEEERRLIHLRLQGYSTVEIAEQWHCDAHALRARLSRLRQRLRDNGYREWL